MTDKHTKNETFGFWLFSGESGHTLTRKRLYTRHIIIWQKLEPVGHHPQVTYF
jgi:hypothetical protein